MKNKNLQNNNGFVALTSVLIISAVCLIIGIGVISLNIGEGQMSLQKDQSSQAYYFANLCAEEALISLKEDSGYLGETISGESINIENSSCIISVEDSWTVKISAVSSEQTKKIKIKLSQIDPQMVISSWEEVNKF